MNADELIARLAAEGELDSVGSFTLDPTTALEKLREFQLRDPTRFVLSWVRAAVLLGASRIDIEIDADDVWLRFDGETLQAADFEALWSSVVGRRGSARVRACRELALGINGAFTWEARSVEVISGELQVGFDREFAMTTSTVAPTSPANCVHAKRPIGWDLVSRRLLDATGELPEELLLTHACAHAAVPIYLEGRLLNPKPDERRDAWLRVAIDDDERRGWLWLRPGERSQLRVLVSGVEVGLVDLPFGSGNIEAVVDDPLLPLDLSQEKAVEGERWQSLWACVSRARWAAWFILATREDWPRSRPAARIPSSPAPEMQALIHDIHTSLDASWTQIPGAMAFADRLVVTRAVTDPEGDLRRADGTDLIWPWPGEPAPTLTLGEVIRSARKLGVLFTSARPLPELAYVPELPVLQDGSMLGLRELGHAVLDRPATLARYEEMLADLRPLSRGRPLPDEWLEQRYGCGDLGARGETHHAASLGLFAEGVVAETCSTPGTAASRLLALDENPGAGRRAGFHHGLLAVRVAWKRGATGGHGALVIGRDGKCLARWGLPPSWGPLWIEVEGPFPRERDTGEAWEELLATAVLAGLARHHDLLAALDGEGMTEHEHELVIGYLGEASGHWSALRLTELGKSGLVSAAACRRAIAAWRGSWGVPEAWADPAATDRGTCDHPLMELAWLEHGDRRLSLRDVQREVAVAGGRLCWTRVREPDPAPPEVWRLTPAERAILAAVFPGALERFDEQAWQRREVGPHVVPEGLPEARASVQLLGSAGERGVLGLAPLELPHPWPRLPGRGARLRLLGNGHELGWMDVPLPIGAFYGVIEVPGARAVAHGDVVLKDDAWRAAAAVVEAGALALAQAQLDAWIAGRHELDDRRRVETWMLDLESGPWSSVAAALANWQATLEPEHPLRIHPDA
jgi:hypothetical protein